MSLWTLAVVFFFILQIQILGFFDYGITTNKSTTKVKKKTAPLSSPFKLQYLEPQLFRELGLTETLKRTNVNCT